MAFAFGKMRAPKVPKRRIRWIDRPGKLVAQVEEKRGLRWLPTEVVEEIDLRVAAAAMAIHDRRNGNTAGDDTAGFGDRLKRFAKRVAKSKVGKVIVKAHTAPLKIAHKITHGKNSPIRKAELALQKYVGKALPFTQPFIAVHNKLAGGVHKTVDTISSGGSAKKALKAGAKKAKPSTKDVGTLVAAGASAAGGNLALPAGAAPTAKELAALVEERRKTLATGISKALEKVPKADRETVRKELVRQSTAWIVFSPRTGIKHQLQI